MYLVIRQIKGKNINRQIPLRIYQNSHKALSFIENYMAESKGQKWSAGAYDKRKRVYCRELKNGNYELLNIRYMKMY